MCVPSHFFLCFLNITRCMKRFIHSLAGDQGVKAGFLQLCCLGGVMYTTDLPKGGPECVAHQLYITDGQ